MIPSVLHFIIEHPSSIPQLIRRWRYGQYGRNTFILKPISIGNPSHIYLGNNVIIKEFCWISACGYNGKNPNLTIKDGTVIGHSNHIFATNKIVIEEDVITADRVYIGDSNHNYQNIEIPIMHQGVKNNNIIKIGAGSWIGENACIVGASIGKHCVIGANCVVTKDVPDYSVVVGIPQRVIKRYDLNTKIWRKTLPNGDFS